MSGLRIVGALIAGALMLGGDASGQSAETRSADELTEDERVLHFLNRFTLGATPELFRTVKKTGIRAWLDAQLEGKASAESPYLAARLAELESLGLTNRQVMDRYVERIPKDATPKQIRERNRLRNIPRNELRDSVVLRGVYGSNQVREVASDFFRNHFCVAVDKGRVRYYATEYEREVIRKRVFGRFGEMLRASVRSPAMLVYLDNVVSRRPPTKAELKKIEMNVRLKTKSKEAGREASDIAGQRGLNENYARELLELHTLGVDNYYSQRDVENVAMTLTGWTVSSDKEHGHVFEFKPAMHYQGDKVFLNARIARQKKNPEAEGEKVLSMLERHKGTAQYLSYKLCRYFVSDNPPEEMVARIASIWTKSGGDLPTVYRAIVDDPEFFARRHYRAKFKRPYEFAVSALRVTHAEIKRVNGIHRAMQAMSEDLYLCKDPTGYYDQAEAWQDAGAFAVRWKFANDLVAGKIPGVRVPNALYDGLRFWKADAWKEQLMRRLLPAGLDPRSSRILDAMIARYLESHPDPKVEELAPRIVGLILGSPEFQQQ
ncbi:MAG: DUF1800 domain-containing protein [Planctomycetota bacterium]|jgi:uncharacterized protein (DUF1800 family)